MSSSNRDWWWKLAFKGWAPQKRLVRTGCWWQEFRCGHVTRQSFLGFISLLLSWDLSRVACILAQHMWSTRMCLPDNCVLCWVVSEGRELTNHYCSPRCSRIRLEGSFQWADISACRVKVLLLFCSPTASRFMCKIYTLQVVLFCSPTCLGLSLFSFLGRCFLSCWDQLNSYYSVWWPHCKHGRWW